MMRITNYKDLVVWQIALDLVEMIYDVTRRFPRDELYGLTNQLRRAAVSVPSNIAEGHSRQSTAEFKHFLSIASGSLAEIETQLLIARRLNYIEPRTLQKLLALQAEVSKMTSALKNKLTPSP